MGLTELCLHAFAREKGGKGLLKMCKKVELTVDIVDDVLRKLGKGLGL